ncbi:MAG: phage major capsid protein [Pseudomonadota bacterium]
MSDDPNVILGQLQAAFEEFKSANDEKLAAKSDDALTNQKIERINSDISDLQEALDKHAKAAAAAAVNGGRSVRDAEYTEAFSAHMKKGDIQANLQKGVDSEGGYLAPIEWDRTITDALIEVSPWRSLATVQTISGNSFKKLFNLRGTASGWVGETAARPETATATFGELTYATGELYANPAATQQMLDDAEVNLEAWLAGEVNTEFAFQEGVAFTSGDGANKPNGILTYVTGGANAAAHPMGAIEAVTTASAGAVDEDDIMSLIYELPTAFTAGAGFVMNRNSMEVVRKLKDNDGQYLWQPSMQAGQPAMLAGYGVTEIPAMPDIATGNEPILFGNFALSYLIVDRTGTRVLRDPFTNKPFVQFYTTKRVGGGLLNPEPVKALTVG